MDGDTRMVRAWLAAAWDREGVADAVTLASPSLPQQVRHVLAGTSTGNGRDPGEIGGAVESVAATCCA